ncbi:unnamed protein product [Blepharisma stoltei]|uniref:Kinesin-like protein n=1 Tax=Blepharisma stoltei TaxID=1481888 RepID=A0AAU9JUD4_9CILI|nr:unnamed protein product [Blepharisma stoltei]
MDPSDESSGNIRVVCRFRPLNEKEKLIEESVCVTFDPDNRTVAIKSEGEPQRFSYDYVFNPSTPQAQIYQIGARPIIDAIMQGFNGTVFAYGQTSSGKTFTMTGVLGDKNLMGIIPRMVGDVFSKILNSDSHIEFSVKVGYCEIYMEKIKDLLEPSKNNLKIHEDKIRGVFIEDLTERYVSSEEEVFELMNIGTSNREVGYTHMNAGSSRSHSIFCVTLSQTNSLDFSTKTGKLYLVDLAGSEKVGKTGAEGKRLEEAKNINKSLTALGQVINALTDGKSSHVPYRDSKLTRVLQDSLGGNSKTALIITCSPSAYNEAETVSTLRFGIRAKSIKNKAKVNKEYTVAELKLMLAKAKEDIHMRDKKIEMLEQKLGKPFVYEEADTKCDSKEESYTKSDSKEDFKEDTKEESEVEISKVSVLDDIVIELEEARTRLTNEVEKNMKLRAIIAENQKEIEELRGDYNFLISRTNEVRDKNTINEELLKEKDEQIEILSAEIQDLKNEMRNMCDTKFDLEQSFCEIEALHSKSEFNDQSPFLGDTTPSKSALKEQLEEEMSKNENLLMKINEFENLLEAKSEVELDKEKLNGDKQELIKELQKKSEKIVKLECELDESKQNYRNLESTWKKEFNYLKDISVSLGKNLELVSASYNQISKEKAELVIEKKSLERKMTKIAKRAKIAEEELKKIKELQSLCKQETSKDKIKVKTVEIAAKNLLDPKYLHQKPVLKTSLNAPMMNYNIKKTITGGQGVARITGGPGVARMTGGGGPGITRRSFATLQMLDAIKKADKSKNDSSTEIDPNDLSSSSSSGKEKCIVF